MTRKEEILTKSIDYGQKTPSEYDDGRYDLSDLELAFEKGAKWADKTMIDKAIDWLHSHANDFMPASYSIQKYDTNGLLYYFKEAMKGGEK